MATFNPSVNQGIDLIFTTTNTDAYNNSIDVSGYTVTMVLTNQNTQSVALTLTNGSGITLTSPTTGLVTYRITGAQATSLAVGIYTYGIRATTAGGINYDWADGTITIAVARA